MSLPELPEPTCFASINKQGDVTSTHKNRDAWRTNPLYTADQMRAYALQAVEALRREPMTEEQIKRASQQAFYSVQSMPDETVNGDTWDMVFARAVEAHHHITQKEQR